MESGLELFFNDSPMTLARWPDTGFALTGRILDSGVKVLMADEVAAPDDPARHRAAFAFPDSRISRWAGASDAWVAGYWRWDWADEYLPVHSIDPAARSITLERTHLFGLRQGARFRVLNILEELDSPGEWYLDRATGLLYFWPPAPVAEARITVSVASGPLISLEDASHITLRGLVIEDGRGTGVRILGGSDNLVAGCTIRNLGTVGVQIGDGADYGNPVHETRGGRRNGVRSCDIHNTGEEGIILAGGDRRTLERSDNFAVNNDIHRFGRIARTLRAGAALAGVGCRLAGNRIHSAPHTAVFFWGNDHLVELNEIFNVCEETSDAGALYIGRDWSMRGNVLRHNFVHDIGSYKGDTMAFYLDDFSSGTTITGNAVVNAFVGVMIGGGRDNLIAGNLWINCMKAAVHVDARGRTWAKKYFDGREPILFNRLKAVNHREPPYSERYPQLAGILEDLPAMPKGNRIAGNLCIGGRWLHLLDGLSAATAGVEGNLVLMTEEEAGLADAGRGDYRLGADSPVFGKLPGFEPIPFDKIGLMPDEYRDELPNR